MEHGDIKRAFVSYPALFKHLAFDGGFLHGVPEQLMRTEDKREGHRASNGQLEEGGTRNQVRSCAAVSPSASSGVSTPRYNEHEGSALCLHGCREFA